MSRYVGTDSYVYPDTGVLRNRGNILDQEALDAFEADAVAVRMLELEDNPIQGSFDLQHLCAVHRHLLQDVSDWAGEIRTVDISRGSSRFANFGLIDSYLGNKLAGLAKESFLRGLAPDEFIARMAHYMGEINAAHPFREGNGRVQRSFCAQLARGAGYFIDFETVQQDEMYAAMIPSFSGNEKPLADLLTEITAIVE